MKAFKIPCNIVVYELKNTINHYSYVHYTLNSSFDIDTLFDALNQKHCPIVQLQSDWLQYTKEAFELEIISTLPFEYEHMMHRNLTEEMINSIYKQISKTMENRTFLYNDLLSYAVFKETLKNFYGYNKEGIQGIKTSKQTLLLKEDEPFRIFLTDEMEFPPHNHQEHELILALDYDFSVLVNNEVVKMHPGDLLFIPSKEIHAFKSSNMNASREIIIFKSPVILNFPFKKSYLIAKDHPIYEDIKKHFKLIIKEEKNRNLAFNLSILESLNHILKVLIRTQATDPVSPYSQVHQHRVVIEGIFDYVNANYMNPISLNDAAGEAGYSLYHFSRLFKTHTGMTFNQYLLSIRIHKSLYMLINTQQSVSIISELCGFNSLKTFNRVFKDMKQMTPSAYRKAKFD